MATAIKKPRRTLEFNGRVFYTMMDVARELGLKRVYPKDFEKYGIKVLDGPPEVDEVKVADTKSDNASKVDKVAEEPKVDTVDKATKKAKVGGEPKEPKIDKIDTLQDYAKFLKKKTLQELVTLCKNAGVDTCESISLEPIRRMHLVMNLKAHYFPGERLETKKPTSFRKIAFGVLEDTAKRMNIEYRTSSNEAITRMWLTKSLIEAGVRPEDLTEEDGGDVA